MQAYIQTLVQKSSIINYFAKVSLQNSEEAMQWLPMPHASYTPADTGHSPYTYDFLTSAKGQLEVPLQAHGRISSIHPQPYRCRSNEGEDRLVTASKASWQNHENALILIFPPTIIQLLWADVLSCKHCT